MRRAALPILVFLFGPGSCRLGKRGNRESARLTQGQSKKRTTSPTTTKEANDQAKANPRPTRVCIHRHTTNERTHTTMINPRTRTHTHRHRHTRTPHLTWAGRSYQCQDCPKVRKPDFFAPSFPLLTKRRTPPPPPPGREAGRLRPTPL